MDVGIAQRLVERRKQAGYTQESLAEKLGVSRQAVSKWERSESSPDTDNLIALAQLYGVSLDELLFEEVQPEERADGEVVSSEVGRGLAAGADAPEAADGCATSGDRADEAPDGEDSVGADEGADSGGAVEDAGADVAERTCVSAAAEEKPLLASESGDEIRLSGGEVLLRSGEGDEVRLMKDGGVSLRKASESTARSFGSLREASDAWRAEHGRMPCGYRVRGEYFETLDEARAKYGDAIDAGEPVRACYNSRFLSAWNRFPYPLFVVLGVALLLASGWGWAPSVAIDLPSDQRLFIWASDIALLLAATIPLYYLLGHAIDRRRPLRFVAEAYTALVIVLMVPSIGQGVFGITWPLLLTIPLVVWAAHALSRRFRRHGQVHAGVGSADASADAPSDMA